MNNEDKEFLMSNIKGDYHLDGNIMNVTDVIGMVQEPSVEQGENDSLMSLIDGINMQSSPGNNQEIDDFINRVANEYDDENIFFL